MTQTFEFVAKLDKNAESGKARNFSANCITRFVRGDKSFPFARRNVFHRKRHPVSGAVDARDNRVNFLISFQNISRMLDFLRPRNIRNVDKPVNSVFDFDKRAEIGNVANLTVNPVADVITVADRIPGIRLKLFHSETDAVVFRVDSEHLNFDFFTRMKHFSRTFSTLRPRHFRNVNQAFDARFKLDKRAVIGHARNFSVNALRRPDKVPALSARDRE